MFSLNGQVPKVYSNNEYDFFEIWGRLFLFCINLHLVFGVLKKNFKEYWLCSMFSVIHVAHQFFGDYKHMLGRLIS